MVLYLVSTKEDESGRTIVEVSANGQSVAALFVRSPRKKGLEPGQVDFVELVFAPL